MYKAIEKKDTSCRDIYYNFLSSITQIKNINFKKMFSLSISVCTFYFYMTCNIYLEKKKEKKTFGHINNFWRRFQCGRSSRFIYIDLYLYTRTYTTRRDVTRTIAIVKGNRNHAVPPSAGDAHILLFTSIYASSEILRQDRPYLVFRRFACKFIRGATSLIILPTVYLLIHVWRYDKLLRMMLPFRLFKDNTPHENISHYRNCE